MGGVESGPLITGGWGPLALPGERKRLRIAEEQRLAEVRGLGVRSSALPAAHESAPVTGGWSEHGKAGLAQVTDASHADFARHRTKLEGPRAVDVGLIHELWHFERDDDPVRLSRGAVFVRLDGEVHAYVVSSSVASEIAASEGILRQPERALAVLERCAEGSGARRFYA